MIRPEPPLPTLVLGLGDGGGALLTTDGAPIEGHVDPETILVGRSPPLFGVEVRGVLGPDAEARAAAEERTLARKLEAAVLGAPGMGAVRDALLLEAGSNAGPLSLGVDLRDPRWSALPWEVLGALPAGSPWPGGLRIVRQGGPGRRGPTTGIGALRVAVWAPAPDDPICARVLEALVDTLDQGERLRRVDDDEADVLHIVVHGEQQLDSITARLGDDEGLSADSLGRHLARRMIHAPAVVLDVCHGGTDSVPALDTPAGRLLAAGATLVIAPRFKLAADASRRFSAGLYGAIDGGASWLDAVEAGRGELAGQGRFAHPHRRWWNPVLRVGRVDRGLETPVLRSRPVVPGWPAGTTEVDGVVEAANRAAEGSGFFGYEHLLLGLAAAGPPALRTALGPLTPALERSLAGFTPTGEPTSSPRLATARPDEGWTVADLVTLCLAWAPLPLLVGGSAVRDAVASLPSPDAATAISDVAPTAWPQVDVDEGIAFEVLGGPDDGLRLELRTSSPSIGRWSDGVGQLLCPPAPAARKLSRQHLSWRAGGQVRAEARCALTRSGRTTPVPAGEDVALEPGDVLVLRDTVRLVVLAAEGHCW